MALRLPELVGSPLSVNALREDLQVAHTTLANGDPTRSLRYFKSKFSEVDAIQLY
jgi:hypothetical protein